MPETVHIAPATSENLTEVLTLVFSKHEAQDVLNRVRAALAEYREGRLPGEGLLAAYRDGCLVGATFAQVLPGQVGDVLATTTCWPTSRSRRRKRLRARLWPMRRRRVRLWFTRCLTVDPMVATLFGSNRPVLLAWLNCTIYWPRLAIFPTESPEGPLTFEPYTPEKHGRLCAVVDKTYEATLDCPGLDGTRTAVEVLEGYATSPGTCPSHWFLIRHEDRDVGCLLLADYGEHGNCELTYMGLVPSARGSGWGLQVTRYAQWVARTLGRDHLVLAVDSVNQPARDMYASAGFRGWDRRLVYMRVLER